MAETSLFVVGMVNALTAATFVVVGVHLLGRPSADRLPVRAITAWWLCMGVLLGIQAAETIAGYAGLLTMDAVTLGRYANSFLLAGGVWGLCFHVIYLYTGRRSHALPLAFYSALVAGAYIACVVLYPLAGLENTTLRVEQTYDPPLDGAPLWTAVLAGVGLPLIAACIALFLVVRKLTRRDQKRRAVLVAAGVFLWVASGLAAQLAGGQRADFLTYTVLSLLTAAVVALAYFPPAWLRRGDPPGEYPEAASAYEPPPGESLYEPVQRP